MPDPLKGSPVTIDGRVRVVKFNMQGIRIAQRRFGGRPLRDVLKDLDVDQVCELGAAALYHEDKTVTANWIEARLEDEPALFPALCTAICLAAAEAYNRMVPPDDRMSSGEGKAGPAPAHQTPTTAGPTGD